MNFGNRNINCLDNNAFIVFSNAHCTPYIPLLVFQRISSFTITAPYPDDLKATGDKQLYAALFTDSKEDVTFLETIQNISNHAKKITWLRIRVVIVVLASSNASPVYTYSMCIYIHIIIFRRSFLFETSIFANELSVTCFTDLRLDVENSFIYFNVPPPVGSPIPDTVYVTGWPRSSNSIPWLVYIFICS